MTLQMTVSPDFAPDKIGGWYVFATWLQRRLDAHIHLELFDSFEAQRKAIEDGKIDLIYANPYDAAMLVRERGFRGVAAPLGRQDEVVVAAAAEGSIQCIEDLQPGARVAIVDDPEVNLIGKILLEPADLSRDNVEWIRSSTYTTVAKQLLQGKADVGFFLKESYQTLSNLTRRQLRVLVTSEISVIRHMLLVGPKAEVLHGPMQEAVSQMQTLAPNVLQSLEFDGFEAVTEEDTEFMIDLIDTLND